MAFTLKINGTPHKLDVDGDTPLLCEGVLHWNGAEILDWYLSTHEPAVIGGR